MTSHLRLFSLLLALVALLSCKTGGMGSASGLPVAQISEIRQGKYNNANQ